MPHVEEYDMFFCNVLAEFHPWSLTPLEAQARSLVQ